MSNTVLSAKFNVRYSGTCGDNDDCGCVDSCPVNTERAELTALEIMNIGLYSDSEWIESIEDMQGKRVSKEDLLAQLNIFMIEVNKRNLPELKDDFRSEVRREEKLTQDISVESDKEVKSKMLERLEIVTKKVARLRRWSNISEAMSKIPMF